MLFNSKEFIFIFLPFTVVIFYLISGIGLRHAAIAWVVFASLFFYGWWNPVYLALLMGSILFNYITGSALSRDAAGLNKKLILALGVAANLGLLGYFKYANFFVENINQLIGISIQLEKIVLPLAISFFTFQQITFLVDTYRGETKEYSFLHYCLFVIFFPQLIAGPIVHHREMLPQFADERIYNLQRSNISYGLSIFLIGLFKKVVLADGVAIYATPVFNAAAEGLVITFFEAWAGALAYTFQIYFDFSGYSDMAIGIGMLFNIRLPLNFNSPYKSKNIIEFWRSWHMTLSRFLRDYLYIPLGGNRKGKVRRYGYVMIVMLFGGLWHGAGWTFVAWGVLHGIYLMTNHGWRAIWKSLEKNDKRHSRIRSSAGWLPTFLAVVSAWVLFRAESFDSAVNILRGMAGLQGFRLPGQIAAFVPGLSRIVEIVGTMPLLGGGTIMGVFEMVCMFALMFVLIAMPASHEMSPKLKLVALVGSMYFTLQSVLFGRTPSEFLYFQF